MFASSALVIPCCDGQARDLGNYGQTFGIVEPDLLEVIHARLAALAKDGSVDRLRKEMIRNSMAHIYRPAPVAGITKTVEGRSWLYDPTVTLQNDLRGVDGVVFHHAGEKVDPLDYRPMPVWLVFIDGDDKAQVDWALALDKRMAGKTKIVLVSGPIIDLQRQTKHQLYFDQMGLLTKRFTIAHVPATVSQEGRMLRIAEVKL